MIESLDNKWTTGRCIMKTFNLLKAASCGLALDALAAPAMAADFYKDKTVTITVGSSAGGGYDGYARFLAQHWGQVHSR